MRYHLLLCLFLSACAPAAGPGRLPSPQPSASSVPAATPDPVPSSAPFLKIPPPAEKFSPLTSRPPGAPTPATVGPVSFTLLQEIVNRRCNECHALDRYERMSGEFGQRMKVRAYEERSMPPVNSQQAAEITDTERAQIARWVEDGQQGP